MTSLLNTLSRHPFACGNDAQRAPARTSPAGDAEYQAVFATMTLLLAGGVTVVMTALAHAF